MSARRLAALALFAAACQQEKTSVAWEDVTGKPSSFPTTWPEVAGKPTSYPTTWPEIVGAPASFPSSWDDVSGKPATFPGTWAELTGAPATFPSDWSTLSSKPATFPSDWSSLANKPATFPSEWSTLSGQPATYPSDWSTLANRPATFPVDPAAVQARITGDCPQGTFIAKVYEDGSVSCAASPRSPVTVQLPATAWVAGQCASVWTSIYGALGGYVVPSLKFDPTGACGTVRIANTSVAIPLELPAGPRPFRVRAAVSPTGFAGPFELLLTWAVATATTGVGASSCTGSQAVTVPSVGVQAFTTVEFDLRADPALCGVPGDPLVLSLTRTDAAANSALVRNAHVVFD